MAWYTLRCWDCPNVWRLWIDTDPEPDPGAIKCPDCGSTRHDWSLG